MCDYRRFRIHNTLAQFHNEQSHNPNHKWQKMAVKQTFIELDKFGYELASEYLRINHWG